MKIAIITLPLHTNYGGILQAYALQTVLERMGHEVILLEPKKRPLHNIVILPLVWLKRAFRKFILGRDVRIFTNPWIVIRQNTDKFIQNYIKIDYITKWDNLLAQKYDAFVVGSDQIWRPCCCPELSHAYLDFTLNSDVLRFSYAASLGTDEEEYTKEQIQLCKPLIDRFNIVTVRENSGIDLISKYFDINASQVLDPTMLLESRDYIKLFENANTPKSKGNLLVYILDSSEEKSKIISEIEKDKGLKSFNVTAKVDELYAPISERIQPPLEEWLRGFYDAELVFTDSFHACVFAILFHKPFIVFGNTTRGMTRFNSLLELFDLKERLILSYEDFTNKKNDKFYAINYTIVDRILDEKRLEAFEVLRKLNKCKHW